MAIGPVAGMAFLKIAGIQYTLEGDIEIQSNTTENEWMANADGSIVYTQKGVVPYISIKVKDSGGLSLQALAALAGTTITAALINGKNYVLQQGAPWGEIKLDAIKGSVALKFGGLACYETLSP